MYPLCALALVALTFDLGAGQGSTLYEWLPSQMPHPFTKPRECGLKANQPGYICDPNKLLMKKDLELMEWKLTSIAETPNARCPCSQYHCDNQMPGSHRFYKISVALVAKLALPQMSDGKREPARNQAVAFANQLESNLWNMGKCEEDIVILFSRDDNMLVTAVGPTAGMKLTEPIRNAIHSMVGEDFKNGRIIQGLNRMVDEYDGVLTGRSYWGPSLGYLTGSSASRLSAAGVSLALTLLLSYILS